MEDKEKIYISQKVIIFDGDGKVLTMRRTKTAPTRLLCWDLPGGDLEFGENLKEGIIREVKEETGLEVQNLSVIDAFGGLNDKKEFWITICYMA